MTESQDRLIGHTFLSYVEFFSSHSQLYLPYHLYSSMSILFASYLFQRLRGQIAQQRQQQNPSSCSCSGSIEVVSYHNSNSSSKYTYRLWYSRVTNCGRQLYTSKPFFVFFCCWPFFPLIPLRVLLCFLCFTAYYIIYQPNTEFTARSRYEL